MRDLIPDPYDKYTRAIVLVVLVLVSIVYIFGIGGVGVSESTSQEQQASLTTLEFGLDMEGGTRITAPLNGYTAEQVELEESANTAQLSEDIASNLETADPSDVNVYLDFTENGEYASQIEVTEPETSEEEFREALDSEQVQYEEIRSGVTEDTRSETVSVIENKIDETGLSGGSVREVTSVSGQHFILIEVPGEDRSEVVDLLDDQGFVQIDIYYPTTGDNGTTYETRSEVLTQSDFQNIGSPSYDERSGWHIPVVVQSDAAESFRQDAVDTGLAQGGSRCQYETQPENTQACLLTKVDGEVVYSAGMDPGLGNSIQSGSWTRDPSFILQTESQEEANNLSIHLRAGALPAQLDFESGTSAYISSEQGERFKFWSIIIGLVAIGAVATKIHYRYRDLRVSAPMILSSVSEVIILAGFASFVGYPIDLSVIGGFIAVIGTGIDDLIIIANEILAKGDVNSDKVFQKRYGKAYWIIGAAALTTIITLTPLIALGLGALAGFAIFTIVGILIGVFITRPAYGDILNALMIEKR